MQAGDIGVIQTGLYFDFAQKPLSEIGVVLAAGQDHFHGLHAIRKTIADAEDLAHSATAQHARDLVVSDNIAHLKLCRHGSRISGRGTAR